MDTSSHNFDPAASEQGCEAEAIQRPGSIQPHGMLLAFAAPACEPDHGTCGAAALVAISQNAQWLTGVGEPAFGQTLRCILGTPFAAALDRRRQAGPFGADAHWETVATLPGAATAFDVAAHPHAGLLIVELEPSEPGDAEIALVSTRRLPHAIARLRTEGDSLEALATAAVSEIRQMTGYARVLVYRFCPEWNGVAIAEDRAPDWTESLLGLHFPASDIPAQARALYCQSLIRWVHDRDAAAVPLLTAPGQGPIDLSHARLRSLSPTHLQYHRNMGVDGSMSLSIVVGGALWGLLVCHDRKPHRTSAGQRAAALALTDAFALRIVVADRAGNHATRDADHRQVARLIAHMAEVDGLAAALGTGPVTVLDLFGATGAAVVLGATTTLLGRLPPPDEVARLVGWLRTEAPPGELFATETLSDQVTGWAPYAPIASGLLVVFLSEDRVDMLLWFRPEDCQDVSWGGRPTKIVGQTGLQPCLSFQPWLETRYGHARAWQPWDHEIAAVLRHAITDVIVRNLRRVATLSDQRQQTQKMDAVGQLTSGLAHDFNNMLGGIVGSIELAQTRLAQGRADKLERYLSLALGAADRAAALTHRLLVFSRRQALNPQPIDVASLVCAMKDLILATLGPAIPLVCLVPADLWTIMADAGQLESALLHQVINARDAMPQDRSGAEIAAHGLSIEAANIPVGNGQAARFGVPPGDYVCICVCDTGTGMSPETAQRAFEPFFTTKPIGQGTGLGLSMLYGFAKQSGGHVEIDSTLGQGTAIRLYLPRHHDAGSGSAPAT